MSEQHSVGRRPRTKSRQLAAGWFQTLDPGSKPAAYDQITAQISQLSQSLSGASPQTVGSHLQQLHERADHIQDAEWRDQARKQIDGLPQQLV